MAYYILRSYKLSVEPLEIFEVFKEERNCFFLDSSLPSADTGRYSFLGIEPFTIFKTQGEPSLAKLRELLDTYTFRIPKSELPFLGAAVGYLAYDYDLGIPDIFFAFYNIALIIDHLKKHCYIFSVGFPERKYTLSKSLCTENFKKICALVSGIKRRKRTRARTHNQFAELKSNFNKEDYLKAVRVAREYIRQGDIYQVNLSQRFTTQSSLSAFEIYRALREISPAHFSAYFDAGDFQILSSSPERFLKLTGRRVITCPMKGTRPRSRDHRRDRCLKKELWESEKDRAELMMIVDLERNDLGRVCSYGSIKVKTLRELEEYNTVFQATATIEGLLHKDKDRIDLLQACFPGGSVTGCPKIRAMEIIRELEPHQRSIYTGSLGYLSFSGDMELNILIRTILKKQERLYFSVGGGIVIDSDPQKEYAETLIKARGMVGAINGRDYFFKR